MKIFKYQIISHNTLSEGEMSAASADDLASHLKARGNIVVSIDENNKQSSNNSKSKITIKDKIVFTKYLSTMIKAGLPLISGIDVLLQDAENKHYISMLEEIKTGLEKGKSLSENISNYPNVFDGSYIAIIKSGETSGQLAEVLDNLAEKLQKDFDLKKQVKAALLYPMIIVSVLILIGIAMLIFVVPNISKMFDKLNLQKPLATRIMLVMSHGLTDYPLITALVALTIIISIVIFFKSKVGKEFIKYSMTHVPVVKNLSKSIDLARLSLTLSILLKAGVPIENSLVIVSQVVSNTKLIELLNNASIQIKKGNTISQVFKEHNHIIPNIMIKIIEVGEKTGTLEDAMLTLSDSFTSEVDDKIKSMTTLIEPIVMLLVGVAVGVFVISIIGPIYQVVGNVK